MPARKQTNELFSEIRTVKYAFPDSKFSQGIASLEVTNKVAEERVHAVVVVDVGTAAYNFLHNELDTEGYSAVEPSTVPIESDQEAYVVLGKAALLDFIKTLQLPPVLLRPILKTLSSMTQKQLCP